MSYLDEVIRKIKRVEIQGASDVAKAELLAFQRARNKKSAYKRLIKARPTEALAQNLLKLAYKGVAVDELLDYHKDSKEAIALQIAGLIKTGKKIYTHCHSSTVTAGLIEAEKQKKKFTVLNTETRPLYQGRKTVKELVKEGIKVKHYVDSGMLRAIKQADLVLLGADAITPEGVWNKIGSGVVAQLATDLKKPLYICSHSLKYTKSIKVEHRKPKEIWSYVHNNLDIQNPAFELIPKSQITAVISELGILDHNVLVRKVKKAF